MTKGIVADIQRCSTHDGPGIRTTVFLKGCNMRCAWCHNPETVSPEPEWLLYPDKCIGCGMCEKGCFSGARVLCGAERTVADVMAEVMLDSPYYGRDGGLTVSGGEPLYQAKFTRALLIAAKAEGVGTAIETNLSFPWERMAELLNCCDVVMADLKTWDENLHETWTGVTNRVVKENLMKIATAGLPLIVRTPVIPGVNDGPDEILHIAAFLKGLPNLLYYELLPYHPLGTSKGVGDGGFRTRGFDQPDCACISRLASLAAGEGVEVRVGGKAFA